MDDSRFPCFFFLSQQGVPIAPFEKFFLVSVFFSLAVPAAPIVPAEGNFRFFSMVSKADCSNSFSLSLGPSNSD